MNESRWRTWNIGIVKADRCLKRIEDVFEARGKSQGWKVIEEEKEIKDST